MTYIPSGKMVVFLLWMYAEIPPPCKKGQWKYGKDWLSDGIYAKLSNN